MAAIPVELTEEQFNTHIKPHLSTAKRGYESKHPLMSWQVPRYHFYKWSKDGSFKRWFQAGVLKIKYELNLSILNFDGSHSAAKKGAKPSPIKGERRPKPAISSQ